MTAGVPGNSMAGTGCTGIAAARSRRGLSKCCNAASSGTLVRPMTGGSPFLTNSYCPRNQ